MRAPSFSKVHHEERYRGDDGDWELMSPTNIENVVEKSKHGGHENGEERGEIHGQLHKVKPRNQVHQRLWLPGGEGSHPPLGHVSSGPVGLGG